MGVGTQRPRVVVIGSSFAGLTGALEVRRRLGEDAEVVVVDRRDHFTFIPSLVWVPFGTRAPEDVTFPLAPTYADKGIEFVQGVVTRIDLAGRRVELADRSPLPYDRLLVATGPHLDFTRVPGLGPDGAGATQSVCNLEHALRAKDAWEGFLEDPGPVVVGTAQGGSCFGASYEFLFNVAHRVRKAGLADRVPMTFITAEPFLGHFGLGGVGRSEAMVREMFTKMGIEGLPNSAIREVRPGELELASGRVLAFRYAMIVPPFAGVEAVRASEGLGNAAGWIPVDEHYRHPEHPEVYAAGVDVAISPKGETLVPAGVPKTGYMSEHMAKVAAQNIAADLGHGAAKAVPLDELGAVCILDGGDTGVILRTDRVLGDASHPHLMRGPHAHWAKVAFEKVFLATRRRGFVRV